MIYLFTYRIYMSHNVIKNKFEVHSKNTNDLQTFAFIIPTTLSYQRYYPLIKNNVLIDVAS